MLAASADQGHDPDPEGVAQDSFIHERPP
jgi:hypothetical protein